MVEAMKSTMEDLFNIQPNPFQQRIIPQILMMMKGMTQPRPLLLVQSTGGGKSAVPQTCGCTKAGVTIVLENTQALGADQCSKLDQLQSPNIITYQLDLLKSVQQRAQFSKDIEAYLHPTNTSATSCLSIFIFSSPEAVISSHFFASIKAIINANKLSLFCIDEVHQYIEFGTTFRKEFCQLKDILIVPMLVHPMPTYNNKHVNTKVPILCMSATLNNCLMVQLEAMLMLSFLNINIYWSSVQAMQKRHIHLQLKQSCQTIKAMKTYLDKYIFNNNSNESKAIVCQNVANTLLEYQDKLMLYMIENKYVGDAIIVEGSIHPELKGALATAFTEHTIDVHSLTYNDHRLYPRILLGTTGCIGAGLDCEHVRLVICNGIPTSIINFIQEIGRCGRNRHCIEQANEPTDCCVLLFNLKDILYIEERIYRKIEDGKEDSDILSILSEEERIIQQCKDLYKVLRFISLNKGCWHILLEKECELESQSFNQYIIPPCVTTCPICDGSHEDIFKRIRRAGVCKFIWDVLVTERKIVNPQQLAAILFDYNESGKLVYGLRASKPKSKAICENTILQLLSCGIIETRVDLDAEQKTQCIIGMDEIDGVPKSRFELDKYWEGLNLF